MHAEFWCENLRGKNALGRPIRRWEDIKMVRKEI